MSSSSSQNQSRNPKKSAFSCEACRKRKVKCDASHPICNRCKTRGDSCVYKLSPTLSYTQRLEARIAELEAALASATVGSPSTVATESSQDISAQRSDTTSKIEDLRVEDDGRISFHGPTSLFQLPQSVRNRKVEHVLEDAEAAARKEKLVHNAWRERQFERYSQIAEPFRYLLESHWCWIQPLFNFVYRPAFTRDMKTQGTYFSLALLNAMLSHSVRWCKTEPGMQELLAPYDGGAEFFRVARSEIMENIQQGYSKVPTVQALLLLSAHECGKGNRTQAWLYSGMAFRLIEDMGITVDGQQYANSGHFSAEDIEIRKRLFWSCYFWDKLLSLYFGRSPVLQESLRSPPRVLMDDTAEIETWTPHGMPHLNYPPTQAHSISCFIQVCGLAEIFNDVLLNVYSPMKDSSASRALHAALEQSSRLREWWRDLPDHLRINVATLPDYSPPSHIMTLNCLYHTINILLHRAILRLSRDFDHDLPAPDQNPLLQCVSSATSIIALFGLFVRTFGYGHVVLAVSYSIYTAASIFLLEIQAVGHAAAGTLERLSYCVATLERVKTINPVMSTAIELINKELEALGIRLDPGEASVVSRQPESSLSSQAFLPLQHTNQVAPAASTTASMSAMPAQGPLFLDTSYMGSQWPNNVNYNVLDMTPEMLDAFSQIEPMTTTMNPGFDMF